MYININILVGSVAAVIRSDNQTRAAANTLRHTNDASAPRYRVSAPEPRASAAISQRFSRAAQPHGTAAKDRDSAALHERSQERPAAILRRDATS